MSRQVKQTYARILMTSVTRLGNDDTASVKTLSALVEDDEEYDACVYLCNESDKHLANNLSPRRVWCHRKSDTCNKHLFHESSLRARRRGELTELTAQTSNMNYSYCFSYSLQS